MNRKPKEDDPAWIGDPIRREYHTVGVRYGHDSEPDPSKTLNMRHVKHNDIDIAPDLAERILETSKSPKPMFGGDIVPAFAPDEAMFQPGDVISFPLPTRVTREEDLRIGKVNSFQGWTQDFREIYEVKLDNSEVVMITAFRDGEAQKV